MIGAAKCGTTSLHTYLDLHPDIGMAREKELNFFLGGADWDRGLPWYQSRFDATRRVRGESSVRYSAAPRYPGVPERLHTLLPDAKLIYLVRDPIDRIVSDYAHRYVDRRESRSIDEALSTFEGNDLVERSRYVRQLEEYLPYYPMERIRVVDADALRARREETLRGLYEFLEVDPDFTSDLASRIHHETRHKRRKSRFALLLQRFGASRPARIFPPHLRRQVGYVVYRPFTRPFEAPRMTPETRDRLEAFFAPEVARLRDFTGLPLSSWNV